MTKTGVTFFVTGSCDSDVTQPFSPNLPAPRRSCLYRHHPGTQHSLSSTTKSQLIIAPRVAYTGDPTLALHNSFSSQDSPHAPSRPSWIPPPANSKCFQVPLRPQVAAPSYPRLSAKQASSTRMSACETQQTNPEAVKVSRKQSPTRTGLRIVPAPSRHCWAKNSPARRTAVLW